MADLPHLFRPLPIAGLTLANRIVLSPMCQYVAVDGLPGEWHREHHARFATQGLGLAFVEATAVSPEGRITHGCTGLWHDGQIAAHRRLTDLYRRHGVAVGIQLGHAGRKASMTRPWEGNRPLRDGDDEPAWQAVAPSAVAMDEAAPVPHALSAGEVEEIVAAFAAAAERSLAAGYDVVEIHGAHGYLLHAFLSPLSNLRDDAWGGDARRRMALPLAVCEAVRAVWPRGRPLFYRVSAVDGAEGGLLVEDTVAFARALKSVGIDVVDCSSGGISRPSGQPAGRLAPGFQTPFARAVRDGAGIPTVAVGAIFDPHQAEAILAEGMADLVALGRQLIAEPGWPHRAALALGHPAPHAIIDRRYGLALERRAAVLDLSPPAEAWPGRNPPARP